VNPCIIEKFWPICDLILKHPESGMQACKNASRASQFFISHLRLPVVIAFGKMLHA